MFCVSGLYLLQQWLMASYYNIYANKEELLIHSVVQNVTNGLHDRLKEVPEALPVVADILEENLIYLESMAAIDTGSTYTEGYLGKGYLRTIAAWLDLGDYSRAAKYADKAVEELERLASVRSYLNWKVRTSHMLQCGGYFHAILRNLDKAVSYYSKGVSLKRADDQSPNTEIKSR